MFVAENPVATESLFFHRDRCHRFCRWRATENDGTVWQWPKWKPSKQVAESSGAGTSKFKTSKLDMNYNPNSITTIFQVYNKILRNEAFLMSRCLRWGERVDDGLMIPDIGVFQGRKTNRTSNIQISHIVSEYIYCILQIQSNISLVICILGLGRTKFNPTLPKNVRSSNW